MVLRHTDGPASIGSPAASARQPSVTAPYRPHFGVEVLQALSPAKRVDSDLGGVHAVAPAGTKNVAADHVVVGDERIRVSLTFLPESVHGTTANGTIPFGRTIYMVAVVFQDAVTLINGVPAEHTQAILYAIRSSVRSGDPTAIIDACRSINGAARQRNQRAPIDVRRAGRADATAWMAEQALVLEVGRSVAGASDSTAV